MKDLWDLKDLTIHNVQPVSDKCVAAQDNALHDADYNLPILFQDMERGTAAFPAGAVGAVLDVNQQQVHSQFYTIHTTHYALRTTLYALHPTPYTLHRTPYTLHPTPYT